MFLRSTTRADPGPAGHKKRRLLSVGNLLPLTVGVVSGALVSYELETSAVQSRLFARYASRLSYELHPGDAGQIAFPVGGPFDERRGYSSIPHFVDRLAARGFVVTEQVDMSPELRKLVALGVAPPYQEPSAAGLVIRGAHGTPLYDARRRERAFVDYDEVPELMVDALLFIENRELLAAEDPRSNPTLEWDRMAKASLLYVGSKMGLPFAVQGGSTLATQLEKFRHSPHGRTTSPQEKLRQITSASLKAYRYGLDTTRRRREIIVDYLNSMPLAATPGFGEVNGIGEGLEAWFGLKLDEVAATLRDPRAPLEKRAGYFSHVLALLASLPAPTNLLARDRDALVNRMMGYLTLMEREGIVGHDLGLAVRNTKLHFLPRTPLPIVDDFVDRKAATAVRAQLLRMTGLDTHYELNQLHLEVDSAIDIELQEQVLEMFRNLADKDFVARHGLNGKYLLERADPTKVAYGLLLYERTPDGNVLRVQVDTLDRPFDLNRGAKVELGSTAKLRTLAHYLEIVGMLHEELKPLDAATLRIRARAARDPLTAWVAEELSEEPEIDLAELLDRALERPYSRYVGEPFFTGGGLRYFTNFDRFRGPGKVSLRVALQHSINLVFVRVMRDVVRYHEARLPYDTDVLLEDPRDPTRLRMLEEIAASEALSALRRAYQRYRGKPLEEIVETALRKEQRPEKRLRKLAILHYAWTPNPNAASLAVWLNRWFGPTREDEVFRMMRAYGNPKLNLSDYGYLTSRHPLELWVAGELIRNPEMTWEEAVERSGEARATSSQWLFKERNVKPQNRRLRVRIEKDAFARMTPHWQRLGFPFDRLVPSYATALGSSGDRPAALARLLGIIVDDGMDAPLLNVVQLRFARDTPYETALRPAPGLGERVLDPAIAAALRDALAGVVRMGTASVVNGVFRDGDGVVAAGGKTGTGDNRRKTFNRWGELKSSRAINRTASFAFFIGDRFFGVVTAFVPGREAEDYRFTSKLALYVLRLVAPAINERLAHPPETVLVRADAP
jgi:membrane peptidoglycan carboxypeptidase